MNRINFFLREIVYGAIQFHGQMSFWLRKTLRLEKRNIVTIRLHRKSAGRHEKKLSTRIHLASCFQYQLTMVRTAERDRAGRCRVEGAGQGGCTVHALCAASVLLQVWERADAGNLQQQLESNANRFPWTIGLARRKDRCRAEV